MLLHYRQAEHASRRHPAPSLIKWMIRRRLEYLRRAMFRVGLCLPLLLLLPRSAMLCCANTCSSKTSYSPNCVAWHYSSFEIGRARLRPRSRMYV